MKRYAILLGALWRKEIIALSRDRHGLLALFIMPAAFILIMSLALQNYYNPPTQALAWSAVDAPAGEPAQTLLARWQDLHGAPQALPAWPPWPGR